MPQAMPGSTATPFASEQFRGRSKNGAWGDSIEELDWSIGKIMDKLVDLDLDEQTLVIWTSDNGAPLARDQSSQARGNNKPLHGRGYTTSEGAFRVPTIMWWPGHVPAGTVCNELSTTMDLLPTFAALAQTDVAGGAHIDGHNITGLVTGAPMKRLPMMRSSITSVINCKQYVADRGNCFCRFSNSQSIRTSSRDRQRKPMVNSHCCSMSSMTSHARKTLLTTSRR